MPATTLGMNYLLDTFFGTKETVPTTYYIGLSTDVLTPADDDGSDCNEVSGGSYARVAITNNDGDATEWTVAASGELANVNDVEFPASTASWGEIKSVFISDGVAGAGDIYFYVNISPTLTVGDVTLVNFVAGTLIVSMS